MADKGKSKRTNTYLNKEYFKIVVVSQTKDQSYDFCKFFTGSNEPNRGVFYQPYSKTQLVVFPRYVSKLDHQATTVAVEALILYIENKDDFEAVQDILHRYGQIPIRVIVSDFDATELADSIGGVWYKKPDTNSELQDYINSLDQEEFKKIKGKFEEHDVDNGGTIDSDELKSIAISMGFNPEDENFNKSIYALDLNQDGEITLNEFITWWKIGRQNTMALPKIFDLYHSTQDLISNLLDMKEFKEEITRLSDEEKTNNVSTQKILFRSPGTYKLKSFIELSVAIGPLKRQEMAVEFLSKFTKNLSSAKSNWVSILIPLNPKQKKIDSNKGKLLLDEFKENCLNWGEEKMGTAFINFFRHLLVFETTNNENSVVLAIRLKLDIEELVKSALQHVIFIFSHLQNKTSSTWLKIKAHSNLDLYEAINRNITLKDFFETSELVLEGSTFSEQLKAFYNSLKDNYKDDISFLQFFSKPDNIDLELECKLEDFFKDEKSWINYSLKGFGLFLDFLKSNLSKELLQAADNLEVAINCFDIFARFKLYTQSTFSENFNIEKNIN